MFGLRKQHLTESACQLYDNNEITKFIDFKKVV